MRAILVGPPGVRDRLRWDLETRSIEVVGEFDTIVDARRAGLDADIVVSTPESAARGSGSGARGPEAGIRDSGFGIRHPEQDSDRDFEEALTHRELEVLQLLAEGLPNKGIAERLGISDQTVKFHIASIMGKLGASNRVETVRRAVRRGLLSL
jgi:DNA-binding NarL/FixJ family response regulator